MMTWQKQSRITTQGCSAAERPSQSWSASMVAVGRVEWNSETLVGTKRWVAWKHIEKCLKMENTLINENVLITVPLQWFTDHLELDFQETKLFQSSQEQKMAPSEFHLNRSAFEFWHASHCAILLDRPFDKQMFSCTFYHSLNQSGCHEKGVRLWRLLW